MPVRADEQARRVSYDEADSDPFLFDGDWSRAAFHPETRLAGPRS